MKNKKKMKNPLRHRLLRELASDLGKYLVIFLLMCGSIALVSGFLVADNSVYHAYNEAFEKYNMEDGHFRTEKALNKAQRKTVESFGITIYENYYIEETVLSDRNLRIYGDRDQVDLVCLMSGRMPENTGEIALDRMFAVNNHLEIGDTLESDHYTWTITGYVALPDYSCLFEDNADAMFDSITFGVAVVCPQEAASWSSGSMFYNYSWLYDQEPADETEENSLSEDLLENLNQTVKLEDYVPAYQNQAITFTGEDMESDKAMWIVMLYMITAILAFVFAVTISNTITAEANVIGTLRASGYTKSELIRHYMTLPVIVTIVGALLGNILGYTVMTIPMVNMYYGSYSLPTYVQLWNGEAFLETTVVPILLMLVINRGMLARALRLSPQQFLRRDLTAGKKKNLVHLSKRIPFFSRFTLRVVFQNVSNYVVLTFGILFANLILLFGLGFPAILDYYQDNITSSMFCNYQYMLNIPAAMTSSDTKLEELITSLQFLSEVETDNPDAEKFMAYSLQAMENENYKIDEVTLYGIDEDSRYIDLDFSDDKIWLSSAYADKYGKKVGDTISLTEKYEDKVYEFTIDGIYDYEGSVALFMSRSCLNRILDYDEDMFAGYLSDTPITDIDEEYIGTVIDQTAMTKISRQLTRSMGQFMKFLVAFAILVFLVLMYLLSKIIIDKNAQSISMAKILGYSDGEIARLYILPTSLMVVLIIAVSLPLEKWAVVKICHLMLLVEMTGWMPLVLDPMLLVEMFFMGVGSYAVVAALEMRRIRKVPMDMALKNVE